MEFGIQIPRIPDSTIPNSKVRDSKIPDPRSRFQSSKGSRLGIPNRVSIASSRYHLR
ncbi:MAG: hypothetical protein IPK58_22925 [Acidobacteria bacterium]|nr:hypothetical protein [Acidobacteriota bacterium]